MTWAAIKPMRDIRGRSPTNFRALWNDGGYYFVYGDQIMRYDAVTRSPSPGYPRPLANDPALAWLQSLR